MHSIAKNRLKQKKCTVFKKGGASLDCCPARTAQVPLPIRPLLVRVEIRPVAPLELVSSRDATLYVLRVGGDRRLAVDAPTRWWGIRMIGPPPEFRTPEPEVLVACGDAILLALLPVPAPDRLSGAHAESSLAGIRAAFAVGAHLTAVGLPPVDTLPGDTMVDRASTLVVAVAVGLAFRRDFLLGRDVLDEIRADLGQIHHDIHRRLHLLRIDDAVLGVIDHLGVHDRLVHVDVLDDLDLLLRGVQIGLGVQDRRISVGDDGRFLRATASVRADISAHLTNLGGQIQIIAPVSHRETRKLIATVAGDNQSNDDDGEKNKKLLHDSSSSAAPAELICPPQGIIGY